VVLGALALAFQVFAGHLQDTILTAGAVGLYALYRAATERGEAVRRRTVAGTAPSWDRCPAGCCPNPRAGRPALCGVDEQ